MKKVDYNIEFAHIYVNEALTNEHFTSAAIAQKAMRDLESSGETFVSSVLIDDYNPTDSTLDIQKFVREIGEIGMDPDYVVMESSLVAYRDIALDEMNGKIKSQYSKYIQKSQKCPCSFLVAIWHLLRLGALDSSKIVSQPNSKPFAAERIITILPERYKSIEAKAIAIIKSTKFSPFASKIEYIYF